MPEWPPTKKKTKYKEGYLHPRWKPAENKRKLAKEDNTTIATSATRNCTLSKQEVRSDLTTHAPGVNATVDEVKHLITRIYNHRNLTLPEPVPGHTKPTPFYMAGAEIHQLNQLEMNDFLVGHGNRPRLCKRIAKDIRRALLTYRRALPTFEDRHRDVFKHGNDGRNQHNEQHKDQHEGQHKGQHKNCSICDSLLARVSAALLGYWLLVIWVVFLWKWWI